MPPSTCWSVTASLTLQWQVNISALFQSSCAVATMAEVLSCACAGISVSQLASLFSLHRKLLISREERPSSMLKGAVDSLSSFFKAFSSLTINPSHLNILTELPPNLKIMLLQHSEDGSELYGAFYEMTKTNQKGKTTQVTGTLACSKVAKVSVCPQALLALRELTQTFGQETSYALYKEAGWHKAEGRLEVFEEHQIFDHKTSAEEMLAARFREIVQDMEDYLNPLLTQFDFSCLRPQDASLPVPEMTKTKDKDEKGSSVKAPAEQGEYVVLLADQKLLELPLEALSILHEEGVCSVSRDFSLQLLHSRLNRQEPEKGTDGTSLSVRMNEILETHSQHSTKLWEGFMGSKQTPSLFQMQQLLLCRCSAFIYLGMEPFTANIPPAKLAPMNLSECRMALLFDLVQNHASVHRQSNTDVYKSAEQLDLEKPLKTAMLLSMGGVGCVVLNQWHSSFHQNTHNMASVLDNLLRARHTSGQVIHALRRKDSFSDTKSKGHRIRSSAPR
ncbi:Cilia- and flagella-associated protein 46 [Larimichthys crocea]|uniref:Uncharacterized protein n=1 Tax=Larimichthys crocea TaxID=215358 RepID=A0ACD3QCU8_LARCR|nr:Cilia- and flagella-associated protein 46 [Larimichthys crocea]